MRVNSKQKSYANAQSLQTPRLGHGGEIGQAPLLVQGGCSVLQGSLTSLTHLTLKGGGLRKPIEVDELHSFRGNLSNFLLHKFLSQEGISNISGWEVGRHLVDCSCS